MSAVTTSRATAVDRTAARRVSAQESNAGYRWSTKPYDFWVAHTNGDNSTANSFPKKPNLRRSTRTIQVSSQRNAKAK